MHEGNIMELKLITKTDLEWARKARNAYRQYFISQEIINRQQQEEWFTLHKGQFFIIWIEKKRAGTVSVSEENEIGNVLLLKQYQHKGIFKQVFQLIEEFFGKHFFLEVRADNKHAIEVYKKFGLIIVSHKMAK